MDRNKLIEDNMINVVKAAKRFYRNVTSDQRGIVSLDDLISAGNWALVKAASEFDETRGAKFSTAAYKWINGAIQAELNYYLGNRSLLLDDESWERIADSGEGVEERAINNASPTGLSEKKQSAIITGKLKEFNLKGDELKVYLAVNGIGCRKVTNLKSLARELGKTEMEIRRLRQSGERKIRKEIYNV